MDIYKNTANGLFYKVEGGRVYCIRVLEKENWSISNFSIEGFNSAVKSGHMVLEISENFSLENE